MQRSCLQEDCTVGETGVCLLNENLETCTFRVSEEIDSNLSNSEAELVQPQNKVETNSRLPTSFTLTLKKVRETMGGPLLPNGWNSWTFRTLERLLHW